MNQTIIDSKKAVVAEIVDKMRESQSTVVVEYRGLSVREVTAFVVHLELKMLNFGKFYKDTLAEMCLAEEVGFNDLTETLTGPNAIAFGKDASCSSTCTC